MTLIASPAKTVTARSRHDSGRAHLDHVAVGGGAVPRELTGQDAGRRPDEQHIDRREPHGVRASVEICQGLDNLRLVHAKIV